VRGLRVFPNPQSLIPVLCNGSVAALTGVPKPNPKRTREPVKVRNTVLPFPGLISPLDLGERTAGSSKARLILEYGGEKRDKCSGPVRHAGLAARRQNKFTGKPTFTAVLKPIARSKKRNKKERPGGRPSGLPLPLLKMIFLSPLARGTETKSQGVFFAPRQKLCLYLCPKCSKSQPNHRSF
jgi:hypothetical protein